MHVVLDCRQSLSGQSRGCAHSAARLERGEINENSFAPVFSRSAISRDLATIQKGTACSLMLSVNSELLTTNVGCFCFPRLIYLMALFCYITNDWSRGKQLILF